MALDGKNIAVRAGAGAIYICVTGIMTLLCTQTAAIVMAATAGICCNEFCKMMKAHGDHPQQALSVIIAVLIPLVLLVPNADGTPNIIMSLAVAFFGALAIMIQFIRSEDMSAGDAGLSVFAFLYTGLTLCSIVFLRNAMPGIMGGVACVLMLASVWFNDVFAYLGGSAFGKHKFAPRISPKKSWEGVISGMIGSMVFWLLIPLICKDCGFGYACAAITGLAVGCFCVCGDLVESRFKRYFGVKDAGKLMPGHGGLLDRSDSMLVCAPIALWLVMLFAWLSNLFGVIL